MNGRYADLRVEDPQSLGSDLDLGTVQGVLGVEELAGQIAELDMVTVGDDQVPYTGRGKHGGDVAANSAGSDDPHSRVGESPLGLFLFQPDHVVVQQMPGVAAVVRNGRADDLGVYELVDEFFRGLCGQASRLGEVAHCGAAFDGGGQHGDQPGEEVGCVEDLRTTGRNMTDPQRGTEPAGLQIGLELQ